MANATIRFDKGVKESATIIAEKLGLTFNATMNILAKKFVQDRGFTFEFKLPANDIFEMTPAEIEKACVDAVIQKEDVPISPYTTILDPDSDKIIKVYSDGRREVVLE